MEEVCDKIVRKTGLDKLGSGKAKFIKIVPVDFSLIVLEDFLVEIKNANGS